MQSCMIIMVLILAFRVYMRVLVNRDGDTVTLQLEGGKLSFLINGHVSWYLRSKIIICLVCYTPTCMHLNGFCLFQTCSMSKPWCMLS